jgi:hypothetical protein
MPLDIAKMFKGKHNPVHCRLGQAKVLGQLGLGGPAGTTGECLQQGKAPLEGGRMGDGRGFH